MVQMRRSIFISITIVIFFTSIVNAQSSLQVEVTNLSSNKGHVSMELLNKDNQSLKGKTELIKENTCHITFTNLKDGNYAIRYFHDENSNKELDTNFLGIPKEGIGFSNDAYGKFGPKDFKHWLFEVKGNIQIKLITTYY
jgi:uncharacterized protein (DUF2141 family)